MSRFSLAYPLGPPIESVRDLVGMVRAGLLSAERSAFAHHLWIVQGYVQLQILGPGEVIAPLGIVEAGDARRLTDEQALEELSTIADFKEGFAATLPIPWRRLLLWLLEKAVLQLA